MDTFPFIVDILILAASIYMLVYVFIQNKKIIACLKLRKKVREMGSPYGKSLEEVTALLGEPKQCQSTEHYTVALWIDYSYYIMLSFCDNCCFVILNESE